MHRRKSAVAGPASSAHSRFLGRGSNRHGNQRFVAFDEDRAERGEAQQSLREEKGGQSGGGELAVHAISLRWMAEHPPDWFPLVAVPPAPWFHIVLRLMVPSTSLLTNSDLSEGFSIV